MTQTSQPLAADLADVYRQTAIGHDTAPHIFVDNVTDIVLINGVIRTTLESVVMHPQGADSVPVRQVVGHLRMTPQAAQTMLNFLQQLAAAMQPAANQFGKPS